MNVHFAALAIGFLLAAIAGGGFISPSSGGRRLYRFEEIVLGIAAGLPLLGASVFLFSILGISLLPVALALAAACFRLVAVWIRPAGDRDEPVGGFPARATLISTVAVMLVSSISLAKIIRTPLWSWDHFAIWGANARRWAMVPASLGPIRFFRFHPLFQGYLSGLPAIWRGLCLGARPSPGDFKVCHVVFGLLLLIAARRAIGDVSGSETTGNVLTAWLAASPLFWNTEAVGLADLPLALFATVALLFLPGQTRRKMAVPFWICLLALPWIKNEGLALAAGILLAAAFRTPSGAERRRRYAVSTVGFGLVLGVAAAGMFFQEGDTPTFFRGDWTARLLARLPALPHICWRMAVELLRPGWLGVWPAVALALGVALVRRDSRVLPYLPILIIPFSADLGVYLATYLTPEAHIASSFGRISGALLPAALVAVGALLDGIGSGAERNLPVEASS